MELNTSCIHGQASCIHAARITAPMSAVHRDGNPVQIIAWGNGDIQVGCTFISRSAMLKLKELSDVATDRLSPWVIQKGQR